MIKFIAIAALVALVLISSGIIMSNDTGSLHWDLSANRHVDSVCWPKEGEGDSYILRGSRGLSILIAPDVQFDQEVTFVEVRKAGNAIDRIYCHLPIEDSIGIVKRAGHLIRALKLDRHGKTERALTDLTNWQAQAESPTATGYLASRTEKSFRMDLTVHHSFNPSRPWFIVVSVFFNFSHPSTGPASTRAAAEATRRDLR